VYYLRVDPGSGKKFSLKGAAPLSRHQENSLFFVSCLSRPQWSGSLKWRAVSCSGGGWHHCLAMDSMDSVVEEGRRGCVRGVTHSSRHRPAGLTESASPMEDLTVLPAFLTGLRLSGA